MAGSPYAWQYFICWASDVAYPLHAQKLYVHCWGMMNAHGVIRADFTILLILLHVSSTDSPTGLKPMSETSKIPENYYPLHQYSPSPFFFFFCHQKGWYHGFWCPSELPLAMPSQWWAMSSCIRCLKCARCPWPLLQGWSVQDLKFTPFPFSIFYMFSESLPILLLQLHVLNPRLCTGQFSFFNPIFFSQPSLAGWRTWADQAAFIWRRICSCFVLPALWWLDLWWFMEKSADFLHQFSW